MKFIEFHHIATVYYTDVHLPHLLACWMVFFWPLLDPKFYLDRPGLRSKTLICTDALVYVPEEMGRGLKDMACPSTSDA